MSFKKQKTQWIVLSVALTAVAASHVNWIQDDLGYLLTIDGRPIDLIGNLKNEVTHATRHCENVARDLPTQHKSAPFIRVYLSHRVEAMPAQLINCFDPQSKSFN